MFKGKNLSADSFISTVFYPRHTGMALNFILQNNFKESEGMRADARKIGVLITDGKSQDDIVFNSQNLRDSGIELYAIGGRFLCFLRTELLNDHNS